MNLCSPSARKGGIVSINLFELFETKIIECEDYKINLASPFFNSSTDEQEIIFIQT